MSWFESLSDRFNINPDRRAIKFCYFVTGIQRINDEGAPLNLQYGECWEEIDKHFIHREYPVIIDDGGYGQGGLKYRLFEAAKGFCGYAEFSQITPEVVDSEIQQIRHRLTRYSTEPTNGLTGQEESGDFTGDVAF